MKLALFNDNRLGVVDEDNVYDISSLVGWDFERPQESLVTFMRTYAEQDARIRDALRQCPVLALADVRLRPPVPAPSKIVAAPVNYRLHQDEMNQQFNNAEYTIEKLGFFLKAPSSIIGPGDTILLPFRDRRTDHEAEIAFVIGRDAKDISEAEAADYIFGYFALMDITVRGKEDRPWRKSFDTFTPIGPWIVTADEMMNPNNVDLRLWVNDEVRQETNTNTMIYGCYKFLSEASKVLTLKAGDIVTTGTPEGVGPIQAGDTVRIQIERIGEFSVQVEYRA
ncbi:fumarylacetoacetate hydrolase family protein [Alicyclobacillus sp. ALC3]|uniref:fumarylacetoacetate hydrolase family protein n=1 Tax=Alicyclobacillus sp. ALC3 TaxID=2796143 RepID=UPI00237A0782|nr:fumarylacetoacetate hydrolase family protein [Alicyclobacillus sp. ALC3]WDL97637.1 fumarylacetoacetate hydrolase family protein [Alicyclobacillus sp. ALC3]